MNIREKKKNEFHNDLAALLEQAISCQSRGKLSEAEELVERVLTELDAIQATHTSGKKHQAEHDGNVLLRANALRLLGVIASRRGDQRNALRWFNDSLEICEAAGDSNGIARCWGNIGGAYEKLGEYEAALDYHTRALTLNENTSNTKGMATNLGNIGVIYMNRSDYPQALGYFNRAVVLCEALEGSTDVEIHLSNIGQVYANISEYSLALQYFERSLAIFEKHGKVAGMASNYNNIGIIYTNISDFDRALHNYEQALALAEKYGLKPLFANCLGNIGKIHLLRKDLPRALEYSSNARRKFEETGDQAGIEKMLVNIGIINYESKDFAMALENYFAALSLIRKLGKLRGEGLLLGNIGGVYANTEFAGYDPVLAEEYLLKSIEISDTIGVTSYTRESYGALSRLYAQLERWKEAHESLLKCYALQEVFFNEVQHKSIEKFNIRQAIVEKERQMQEQKLKTEYLEREMKRQQETLSNKALQLVRQTDMLQNFRNNLDDALRKADSAEKAIKEVKKSLKDLPENMLNWEKFHEEFNAVHPDFEAKLKAKYPALTATESKVCCLLHIGMSTSEISTMLFISERTVDIHRGHIRKKTGMRHGADIRSAFTKL